MTKTLQERAREGLVALFGNPSCGDCISMSECVCHGKICGLYPFDLDGIQLDGNGRIETPLGMVTALLEAVRAEALEDLSVCTNNPRGTQSCLARSGDQSDHCLGCMIYMRTKDLKSPKPGNTP